MKDLFAPIASLLSSIISNISKVISKKEDNNEQGGNTVQPSVSHVDNTQGEINVVGGSFKKVVKKK